MYYKFVNEDKCTQNENVLAVIKELKATNEKILKSQTRLLPEFLINIFWVIFGGLIGKMIDPSLDKLISRLKKIIISS